MGQPTPPGDMPLYEGLDSSWNDIVGAFPEDKRAELAPKLKSRIDEYSSLQPWGDFAKQGVTPEQAGAALNLYNIIETNPRQVYDTIGKYLGVSAQEAKAVVEGMEDGQQADPQEDPRLAALQQQVEVLSQIMLVQRDQGREAEVLKQQEQALDNEIATLKNKYGEDNVDEEQILMRMLQKGVSAEQAFREYEDMVTKLRTRRPAPMLMGNGGAIPSSRAIDPKKLDGKDTRSLVTQMLEHARDENRR